MRLRFRLCENFNIVINGVVRDFGGKDQRKRKHRRMVWTSLYSLRRSYVGALSNADSFGLDWFVLNWFW